MDLGRDWSAYDSVDIYRFIFSVGDEFCFNAIYMSFFQY